MADPAPPTASSAPAASTASASSAAGAAPKASPQNPALRMLGLPALPKKLPSRNWMIFWTISGAITAGIIYDRREKRKNIAKWRHAVEHLAKEPLTEGYGLGQPRKLTIYLSSPPGDGLRTAQDHYTEYVKPVLAASGLDWEFVQGRREGDVRAYTAERIRRIRREKEGVSEEEPAQKQPTKEEIMQSFRESRGIKEYEGVRGDIVIGRHTWKEYLRGLHEGWLGPLTLPKAPEPEPAAPAVAAESGSSEDGKPAEDQKPAAEEKKPEEEEKKPKRPPQPKPHNTTADYDTASLPAHIPNELNPAATIREPHLLGFLNTPTRMVRFFNRRSVADDIGREVAAVCLAHYREFRELPASGDATTDEAQPKYEQEKELAWEEKDWVKKIWKEDDPKDKEAAEITEKILAKPIVMDPRIAQRMRRFELTPEEEARISKIVVPEEEIEGWTKGTLRSLYRWGASKFEKKKQYPYVGDDVE